MTHKKKDCLERPRKIGARYTGEEIAPDEYMQPNLSFDYDGKRDRYVLLCIGIVLNVYHVLIFVILFNDFLKVQ